MEENGGYEMDRTGVRDKKWNTGSDGKIGNAKYYCKESKDSCMLRRNFLSGNMTEWKTDKRGRRRITIIRRITIRSTIIDHVKKETLLMDVWDMVGWSVDKCLDLKSWPCHRTESASTLDPFGVC